MSAPVALKDTVSSEAPARGDLSEAWAVVRKVLMPLASLKLTLVLFAMSIFLVFTSTLAQKELDIWDVIRGWYRVDERNLMQSDFPYVNFSEFFVRIPLNLANLLDKTLVPDWVLPSLRPLPELPGALWFPRGWVIGLLMAVNLLAAHTVRFTVQARGARLWGGLAMLVLGCLATFAAIESGASRDGILGESWIAWSTLWKLILLGVAAGSFLATAAGFKLERTRTVERFAAFTTAALLGGFLIYALVAGSDAQFDPEAMRILWQLLKGTGAGLVLLAGCIMVFKKRAGIVLLHGGVGLMFLYEVIVGTSHEEAQMPIFEGTKSNWVHDIRSGELVVAQRGTDGKDRVAAIPQSLLEAGRTYDLPNMPLELKLVKFYRNSNVRDRKPGEATDATTGLGLDFIADEAKPVSGVDMQKGGDVAAAYVEVREKGPDGKSLGTYMLSQMLWHYYFQTGMFEPQTFDADGKQYVIELRYKRTYKPYTIEVLEVRKDDYLAGDTPRNYSSLLHVVDPTRGVDRQEPIKMNSPMRFAGETFYQSGYDVVDGRKITTIAVVENDGWMLPYVSCMIVAIGMIAQFGLTLGRFLARRREKALGTIAGVVLTGVAGTTGLSVAQSLHRKLDERRSQQREARREAKRKPETEPVAEAAAADAPSFAWRWLPSLGVALIVLAVLRTLYIPGVKEGEMDLYAFGQLPVAFESRVKPFDSMARSTLVYLSHRQSTRLNLDDRTSPSVSPTKWLLDVVTSSPDAEKYPVFRIDNLDVLKDLGLERNAHSRYSLAQLEPSFDKLMKLSSELKKKEELGTLGPFEREVNKLGSRIQKQRLIERAFFAPDLVMPSREEIMANPEQAEPLAMALRRKLEFIGENVREMKEKGMEPPLMVPTGDDGWQTYSEENLKLFLASNFEKSQVNPAGEKLHAIFAAYNNKDAAAFNRAVYEYRDYLAAHPPKEYEPGRRNLEAYMNAVDPFFWASWMYLAAGVLALFSWLGGQRWLNRTAAWMILATLVYHTAALALRIYVTGRPPVINLYSSAVFIGWGAVVMGMGIESVYKMGVGNVVAAVAGFGSLQIAYLLTRQGDHIESLQAVLDTQFWLTTHVTCITLGYAATYLAGLFGAAYVVQGLFTKSMTPAAGKELTRMTYGTLCFALFFSFVGTVLGGLWADDSWGRFWGWDPKENGALIIVLWNALVLHARWEGIAKDRGLAVLAIAGNITTSWSWFGVNQLGVGLHAYGFSQDLLNVLFWFVAGSALLVVIGSLPRSWWRSSASLPAA